MINEVFISALKSVSERPSHCLLLLEQVASKEPVNIIPYEEAIVSHMGLLLEPTVPRKLLEATKTVWIKLNTVAPREYVYTKHK